jgi:hypothetical protein
MYVAAALFNFVFGVPIMLAPAWSYSVAYLPPLNDDGGMPLRFWSDFGFAVVLIGVGYFLVSRDLAQNRGLVWLGVFAKLFDVVALTSRFALGLAHPLVLVPAAIDGLFMLLFILFLYQTRDTGVASDAA